MPALTIPQKDKIVLVFGDIGRMLYDDPRRYTYDEIDQVLELFKTRGYEVVTIPKPAPLVLTSAPAPASAAPTTPSKLSGNDTYWIESSVIPKYEHAKMNNIAGFNWKNEVIGKLLVLLCKLSGITFKP